MRLEQETDKRGVLRRLSIRGTGDELRDLCLDLLRAVETGKAKAVIAGTKGKGRIKITRTDR